MDFFTKSAVPVAITIDGTAYQLPRFLNRALKAWAADTVRAQKDAAMAMLKTDQERAQFTHYYSEPVFDIATLMAKAQSPEGAEYVVSAQMRLAKVPEEQVESILSDPSKIRWLATLLTQSEQVQAQLGVDPTEKKDPLPAAPDTSGGAQGTGTPNTPASPPSTET